MKIGYILTTYPNRSELFVAREIRHLQESDLDIVVFAAERGDAPLEERSVVPTFYRPSRLSWLSIASVGYILRQYPLGFFKLLKLTLDLASFRDAKSLVTNLHTVGFFLKCLDRQSMQHLHACFLNWPAVIALAISVLSRRSYSISVHARDVFVEMGDAELKVSRSRFTVGCTRQALDHLRATLHPRCHDKLCLNYHGVEQVRPQFPQRYQDEEAWKAAPRIIAIGRFVPKKGLVHLLDAFARLLKCHPECRLQLVGDGPDRGILDSLAKRLSIEESVDFPGWCTPDAVRQLLRGAAMLVVPSVVADDGDRDGIPNVILEAFAVGTPVVATRLPGISEAIEHGVTGILVEPGDVEGIASAVEHLLQSQHLGAELADNAHRTLSQRFDIQKNVSELNRLFHGVE